MLEQGDHVIQQRYAVPIKEGLIPSHTRTLAAGQNKTAHRGGGHDAGHGVDLNFVVPLI